jgi:2-polyprenyl-3-methyl-5-hydroxy-6-metoxy-1,4-benzoquinol methylase
MMTEERTSPHTCLICGSARTVELLEIEQVPVHCNLLWPTREQATEAPRGDMKLVFCEQCGHLFNASFRPELMEYGEAYENALHFSPRFQSYARALADHLVARYDVRGKDIIEIGCGSGEFLKLLCELGDNRGIGIDPGYGPDGQAEETTERVTFIREFYGEQHAGHAADLICCRHVLEHLHDPRSFLAMVRRMIGGRRNTVLFFEVPNALATLRDLGIWDLIYEHRSHFTPSSLGHAFASCGFEICDLSETYAGQFLTVEALPGGGRGRGAGEIPGGPGRAAEHVVAFRDRYLQKIESWRRYLDRRARAGRRVVVWGAGSKGVTFLNALGRDHQIEYVVDINPRKQGMYIAGTGQQIAEPEFLLEYRPDVVIVVNPIYKTEIQKTIDGLGLVTDLMIA